MPSGVSKRSKFPVDVGFLCNKAAILREPNKMYFRIYIHCYRFMVNYINYIMQPFIVYMYEYNSIKREHELELAVPVEMMMLHSPFLNVSFSL